MNTKKGTGNRNWNKIKQGRNFTWSYDDNVSQFKKYY